MHLKQYSLCCSSCKRCIPLLKPSLRVREIIRGPQQIMVFCLSAWMNESVSSLMSLQVVPLSRHIGMADYEDSMMSQANSFAFPTGASLWKLGPVLHAELLSLPRWPGHIIPAPESLFTIGPDSRRHREATRLSWLHEDPALCYRDTDHKGDYKLIRSITSGKTATDKQHWQDVMDNVHISPVFTAF